MRTVKRYDVETQGGALVTSVAPPPPREWEPITPESEGLTGRRVVLAQPLTWWMDMRAISEPYRAETGEWLIKITDEAYWYDHREAPDGVPAGLVLAVSVREVWAE